jgi:hypothetical protein
MPKQELPAGYRKAGPFMPIGKAGGKELRINYKCVNKSELFDLFTDID